LPLLTVAVVATSTGCSVPQRPGLGATLLRTEPLTKRPYWLYLPKGLSEQNAVKFTGDSYPLVVSLHGMRPFDDCRAHVRQWQQEADRYGFLIVAPRLRACDLMQHFPIDDPNSRVLQDDQQAVNAILADVLSTTPADASRVLLTSFSSGGYLAHYLFNRHPEHYTHLAVFQSNFAAQTLDVTQVPKYRSRLVAILYGEKDLRIVREESQQAIAWYAENGFTNLLAHKVLELGHERTPELVASIYANAIGRQPKVAPVTGRFRVADQSSTPDTMETRLARVSGQSLAVISEPRDSSRADRGCMIGRGRAG
jgi:predicted esterase